MRILVAPDKFKGSLDATTAAAAIARGLARAHPGAEILVRPIADGGEGFMETLHRGRPGAWRTCPAVDARGREMVSRYLLLPGPDGPVAVIEMAETAGIARLAESERDPRTATTRGVGMQITHAVRHDGVRRIFLGLGGSATNDAGCGMAAALGFRFLDDQGREIDPLPANLARLRSIDRSGVLPLPEITAACDVDNPLLGPRGATAVFSRQKGARESDQPDLEAALARVVEVADARDAALTPGAGAAGGLGFGLLHFARARLAPGFDLVAGLLDFESLVRGADLIVTGEGSLDAQSLHGKGPVALARMAASHGVPVIALCGHADPAARTSGLFREIRALTDSGLPEEVLFREAAALLEAAAAR